MCESSHDDGLLGLYKIRPDFVASRRAHDSKSNERRSTREAWGFGGLAGDCFSSRYSCPGRFARGSCLVTYGPDGTLASFVPSHACARARSHRRADHTKTSVRASLATARMILSRCLADRLPNLVLSWGKGAEHSEHRGSGSRDERVSWPPARKPAATPRRARSHLRVSHQVVRPAACGSFAETAAPRRLISGRGIDVSGAGGGEGCGACGARGPAWAGCSGLAHRSHGAGLRP